MFVYKATSYEANLNLQLTYIDINTLQAKIFSKFYVKIILNLNKNSQFKLSMAAQLTDAELLSCPEQLELRFMHRGRRDQIASCAGK